MLRAKRGFTQEEINRGYKVIEAALRMEKALGNTPIIYMTEEEKYLVKAVAEYRGMFNHKRQTP